MNVNGSITVTGGDAATQTYANNAASSSASTALTSALATVNALADGTYNIGTTTFITNKFISAPVIAGTLGYIDKLFRVGDDSSAGIFLDARNTTDGAPDNLRRIWIGTGTYADYGNGANTSVYLDSAGKFSLGSKLTFTGGNLTIIGNITADGGAIGGWTVDADSIFRGTKGTDGAFTAAGGSITFGSGWISSKTFYINSSGDAAFKGDITGASGTFAGSITGASGTFGDITLNSSGLTFGNFRLSSSGISYVTYNFNSEVQDFSMFTQRMRLYQNTTNQGAIIDSMQFDYLEAVSSGTVSMQVTPGGIVKKASSSRRFKKNIEDTTLDEAKRILNLNVRSFNGLSQSDDDDKVIGLVAEEVMDLGYNDLVVMGESGSVESVYYQSVFSSMIKVVQDLSSRIEQLEAKLSGSV
jgi:hypothetical protein